MTAPAVGADRRTAAGAGGRTAAAPLATLAVPAGRRTASAAVAP